MNTPKKDTPREENQNPSNITETAIEILKFIPKFGYFDIEKQRYVYVDKEGKTNEVPYKSFSIEDDDRMTKEEQQHLKPFGAAASPYGDKEGRLWLSQEILNNKTKGYKETIALHEVMDDEKNEKSMLRAEQYVVKTIREAADYTSEEKKDLLKQHFGFFTGIANYYLAKPEKDEREKGHLSKIQEVINYLKKL